MKILIIGFMCLYLNADSFTVKYSDLQSVDNFICLDGKLHIMVEIDDSTQPLQVFRTELDSNGYNIPVLCYKQNNEIKIKENNEKK